MTSPVECPDACVSAIGLRCTAGAALQLPRSDNARATTSSGFLQGGMDGMSANTRLPLGHFPCFYTREKSFWFATSQSTPCLIVGKLWEPNFLFFFVRSSSYGCTRIVCSTSILPITSDRPTPTKEQMSVTAPGADTNRQTVPPAPFVQAICGRPSSQASRPATAATPVRTVVLTCGNPPRAGRAGERSGGCGATRPRIRLSGRRAGRAARVSRWRRARGVLVTEAR
jgi:hypothetical protein